MKIFYYKCLLKLAEKINSPCLCGIIGSKLYYLIEKKRGSKSADEWLSTVS